jgi:simple sugar transport system permease protein
MHYIGDKLPSPVLILIMFCASVIAGAIWAGIPGFFKAIWNTNETLFTLMMNYVAMQLVSFFIMLWVPSGSMVLGVVNSKTQSGWFPTILGQKYLLNIIIVAIMTLVVHIYLKRSKQGYEISVVGESENTARYIGINVKSVILRTVLISGALCGIMGWVLAAGADHSITSSSVGGNGFTAIMVSWLGKFNPIAMTFTSFLIVFLENGSDRIVSVFESRGVNPAFPSIITGIILFFIIGCEFFINYKIVFRKKEARK